MARTWRHGYHGSELKLSTIPPGSLKLREGSLTALVLTKTPHHGDAVRWMRRDLTRGCSIYHAIIPTNSTEAAAGGLGGLRIFAGPGPRFPSVQE